MTAIVALITSFRRRERHTLSAQQTPAATLFDSHCHFDFDRFEGRQQQIWQACQGSHISQLLIPGTEPGQWPRAQAMSQLLAGVYFGAGLHPWFIDSNELEPGGHWLKILEDYCQQENCVAVGECGLDGSIALPMERQLAVLKPQLQLAQRLQLPVIIHAHRAHNPIQQLLKQLPALSGVIHAFSGSIELAQSYIKMGFKLGIGGSITYPRAAKTRAAVANLPLHALLLETDAPDMPLHGHQGQANSPERLRDIAECLYQLRQQAGHSETLDEICRQTTENSRKLFNIETA